MFFALLTDSTVDLMTSMSGAGHVALTGGIAILTITQILKFATDDIAHIRWAWKHEHSRKAHAKKGHPTKGGHHNERTRTQNTGGNHRKGKAA